MGIGGFFCFEQLQEEENNYISSLNGDVRHFMSGRCAIYYALQDAMLTDTKRVAYLPAYTCETVISSYEKANYAIEYYDVGADMAPIFQDDLIDKISLLALCGYYGFCHYDRDFVSRCAQQGIIIIEDITHSAFSLDGIDPHCDYIVGSLRKWIGVPSGGLAVKRKGHFTLPTLEPDLTHLDLRISSMNMKEEALKEGQDGAVQVASDRFWSAEMMLRQMFDAHGSDPHSIEIVNFYPFAAMIERRRQNYQYLLDHLNPSEYFSIVFPDLTKEACPSHFTIYANDRTTLQDHLKNQGVNTTAYWPLPPSVDISQYPQAQYIYDHVLSIPCDQRYGDSDMQLVCDLLNNLKY